MASPTAAASNSSKKRSSFASCLACRAQHCACDEVRPCNRCARLGIPCTEGVSRKAKTKQPQYQLETPSISTLMNTPYNELEKELFLERPELHFQPTYNNNARPSPQSQATFTIPPSNGAAITVMSQNGTTSPSAPIRIKPSPEMMHAYHAQHQAPAFFHHPPAMMQTYALAPHPTMQQQPVDISPQPPLISPLPSDMSLSPSTLPATMLSPNNDISSLNGNPLAMSASLISSPSPAVFTPSRHPPDSPSSYLSSPSSESDNDPNLTPSPPTAIHSPITSQFVEIANSIGRTSPTINQSQFSQQHSPPPQPQQPQQAQQQPQQQQVNGQQGQAPAAVMTTVNKLVQEVDDLKHELWLARQKQTNTFPFLNQVQPRSLAMSLWKLPEGELVDFSAGFHAMLALNVYDRITFDLISPKELKVERANLWSFFAREKPCLSGIVTKKPLVNGRGERIVPLSMCALIHFGETTLLQCTFWLN